MASKRDRDEEEYQKACTQAKLFQEHLELQGPKLGDGSKTTAWPADGSDVPYAFIADVLADVSSVGSRLECTKLLTCMFIDVLAKAPSVLVDVVYLAVNKLAPAHEGVELGIGDAILTKVIAEICGMTEKVAKELYQKTGDLAEIAQDRKQKVVTLVKGKDLTARRVLKAFRDIATVQGKDTQRIRGDKIKVILRDAKGPEINFIVRALQGKMRIGVAEQTILTCLGFAFALRHVGVEKARRMAPEKLQFCLDQGAAGMIRVFSEVPSYDIVLAAAVAHGYEILLGDTEIAKAHAAELSIRPGLPVRPMLAHPTNGITTVLNRFEGKKFTCEYKYDGERGQLHYVNGQYHIFSRNSETHTTKYPDVIALMPEVFDPSETTSFILDTEVVAVDEATGRIKNFQALQHRGRKNIDIKDITVKVCVFAFDIMYYNGAPVLHMTLDERRALMFKIFKPIEGKFRFAQYLDSDCTEEIQGFLDQSIADGAEGLMIKTTQQEAEYTPAKRSHYWLKLKKDYMDGATDTLDLVPIGAYHGKGKRTGVFGGFLLACYDPATEEYQSICKLGTGLSDAELEAFTSQLSGTVATERPTYYRTSDKPDVWLSESVVWEVKAADLSISPAHMAAYGQVDPEKGIALRFPRFIKVREDKGPTDATSSGQVAHMYRQQALATAGTVNVDDDVL